MAAQPRVALADVRAVTELTAAIGSLPPAARAPHLLAGLVELLHASHGVALRSGRNPAVFSVWDVLRSGPLSAVGLGAFSAYMASGLPPDPMRPAALRVLTRRQRALTVMRRELVSDREWSTAPFVNEVRRACGAGDYLLSVLPLSTRQCGVLVFDRPWGDRVRFGPREVRLLDAAHTALRWMYRPQADSRDDDHLPPRLRQLLALLKTGRSEKQVAASLGLSQHTVHDYVKTLYRRMGVSSRAELMARWL